MTGSLTVKKVHLCLCGPAWRTDSREQGDQLAVSIPHFRGTQVRSTEKAHAPFGRGDRPSVLVYLDRSFPLSLRLALLLVCLCLCLCLRLAPLLLLVFLLLLLLPRFLLCRGSFAVRCLGLFAPGGHSRLPCGQRNAV